MTEPTPYRSFRQAKGLVVDLRLVTQDEMDPPEHPEVEIESVRGIRGRQIAGVRFKDGTHGEIVEREFTAWSRAEL